MRDNKTKHSLINLQRTYRKYTNEILYDSKHLKDVTKSVESKDQPVILSYNVISKGVRYRRNRRQLLNVSDPYNDNCDDVLYHYNAPVTNEHVNQNRVTLNKGHSIFGPVYKPNTKYSE